MAEAEVDVSLDARDMLVRIGRDDPALRRAFERQSVGEPLHLERVFDREFFLGREAQRRPIARVFGRPLHIRIERNLHLDHAIDGIAGA